MGLLTEKIRYMKPRTLHGYLQSIHTLNMSLSTGGDPFFFAPSQKTLWSAHPVGRAFGGVERSNLVIFRPFLPILICLARRYFSQHCSGAIFSGKNQQPVESRQEIQKMTKLSEIQKTNFASRQNGTSIITAIQLPLIFNKSEFYRILHVGVLCCLP